MGVGVGVGGRLRPPLTTRGMGWGARRGARAHDPPPMIKGRRGRYGREMGEMQWRYRAHVPPPIINAVAAIVGLLRTSCVLPAPGVGGARSARERGEAVAGGKGGWPGGRASARPKQGWGRPAGRVSSCGSRGRNRESTFGTRAPPKPFLSAWNSFCCAGILYGSEVGPGEVHLCRRAPNLCRGKGHQLSRWNACTRGPCTERVSRRARRTCWGGLQTCP